MKLSTNYLQSTKGKNQHYSAKIRQKSGDQTDVIYTETKQDHDVWRDTLRGTQPSFCTVPANSAYSEFHHEEISSKPRLKDLYKITILSSSKISRSRKINKGWETVPVWRGLKRYDNKMHCMVLYWKNNCYKRCNWGDYQNFSMDCALDDSILLRLNFILSITLLCLCKKVFVLRKYSLKYLKVKKQHVSNLFLVGTGKKNIYEAERERGRERMVNQLFQTKEYVGVPFIIPKTILRIWNYIQMQLKLNKTILLPYSYFNVLKHCFLREYSRSFHQVSNEHVCSLPPRHTCSFLYSSRQYKWGWIWAFCFKNQTGVIQNHEERIKWLL